MNGEIDLAWAAIQGAMVLGVSLGMIVAVMIAMGKLAWRHAPWLVIFAFVVWFLA
jgi:type IV secretory pathway VirB3-like protein